MNAEPKPFVKWAGGKAKLVPQLIERIPAIWNRETDLYIEPFVGGGALFFALRPKHALLYDTNEDLINVWWSIQNIVEGVISELGKWVDRYRSALDPAEVYQEARELFNARRGAEHERAGLFIFVNKACFNGLYRVNSHGLFNTPWGRNPKAGFPSAEELRLCTAVLNSRFVKVKTLSFSHLPEEPGWAPWGHLGKVLIYCDPPYVPVSETADFTAYTPGGFIYADQIRLLARAIEWRSRDAHVLLSQAADESLIEQYRRCGFTCDKVRARRNINSKASKRGCVDEYIIY